MHRVFTVSLNDNAYQFEEKGYAALRAYLDRARSGLRDNPDMDEILTDLERSIAEKCAGLLNPGKNVIKTAEIERILQEMGPVVEGAAAPAEDAREEAGREPDFETAAPRRLYRIHDGAILGGVCTGLAAYFEIDVLLVRLLFATLTIMTSGVGGVLAYLAFFIFVPYQDAPAAEQHPQSRNTRNKTVALVILATIAVLLASMFAGLAGMFPMWWAPFGMLVTVLLCAILAFVIIAFIDLLRAPTR